MSLTIKRVYDPISRNDGYRILVDRLWPRGLSKERAGVDLWLRTVAPSTELRKWFGHDPEKWAEFRKRYFSELAARQDDVAEIRRIAARRRTTLLYGARDTTHNHAIVLMQYLEKEG